MESLKLSKQRAFVVIAVLGLPGVVLASHSSPARPNDVLSVPWLGLGVAVLRRSYYKDI